MIYGTGTDIIEIARVEKAMKKGFCGRFFSERENMYFAEKNMRPETVAGNFAAKEAFSKALGTGISGFSLKDVEVLRNSCGKPYIELEDTLKKRLDNYKIFVSISHCRDYATAVVIIEE